MVVTTKQIWVIFLTLIASYSLKIPFINIPIYRVLFPIMTALLILLYRKQGTKQRLFQKSVKMTSICWIVIIVWGFLLSLVHSSVSAGAEYLWWDICLVCVVYCFSFYFVREVFAKTCMGTFFAFSALIGLSGFYECATGRLYHETHITYRVYKSVFGLVKPNTIFYNVNDSAVFMCMALIIAFLFAEYCKRGKFVRLVALLVFTGNIILTESRGALVGALVFLYIYYMRTLTPKKKYIYVLTAIPVILSFVPFLQEVLFTGDVNIVQLGGRGNVWRKSLSNLAQSYFLGNGPGNTVVVNSAFEGVAAVHNWFLETICDYGFIGGISLLLWYIKLISISKKLFQNNRKNMSCMVIVYAGLISFISLSITSSSLFGKVWPICFFGIMIAEINTHEAKEQSVDI